MVIKVLSQYNANPPRTLKAGSPRLIGSTKLYPNLLQQLDNYGVHPVTERTIEMMAIHKVDSGELRGWVQLALQSGTYINSQWCTGNTPPGIYACDAYEVRGMLFCPKEQREIMQDVYVKLCVAKSGATAAVISLHPSN
ncbi:hypothetical protein [Pantoea ananatis]|uniref:hypothetical protein n=1 Tax=Pantoea ananas TaxID=553 RepID=UPI0015773F91|nr:hypothetical protein [Pantoea ananatis]